ncbi:MAG: DUF1565 domain-containing protein, partial [Candidatus Thermoplasmatota archaeon]|nr:DUF1565 domain-containing protein [Candidatus Thermoplasmatota archaeon]
MGGIQTKNLTILLIVILLIIPSSVNVISTEEKNTIYVDDDNTNGPWDGSMKYPYQYIQAGINAAHESDTVFVHSGLYFENIMINKTIQLIGENKNSTIIDGSIGGKPSFKIIIIKDCNTSMNGFTLKNGKYSIDIQRACISIYDNIMTNISIGITGSQEHNLEIRNNVIKAKNHAILFFRCSQIRIYHNILARTDKPTKISGVSVFLSGCHYNELSMN